MSDPDALRKVLGSEEIAAFGDTLVDQTGLSQTIESGGVSHSEDERRRIVTHGDKHSKCAIPASF